MQKSAQNRVYDTNARLQKKQILFSKKTVAFCKFRLSVAVIAGIQSRRSTEHVLRIVPSFSHLPRERRQRSFLDDKRRRSGRRRERIGAFLRSTSLQRRCRRGTRCWREGNGGLREGRRTGGVDVVVVGRRDDAQLDGVAAGADP